MSSMLAGYSFAALLPALLIGIPLGIGFLVYAYRSSGKGTSSTVASLFLLRDLPLSIIGKKKFTPTRQFWIEVIGVLLLSLAAAGVFARAPGEHVAILIDDSLSMAAVNDEGKASLEIAKERSSIDIQEAPSTNLYTVYSTSSHLNALNLTPASQSSAVSLLKQITPNFEEDKLTQQVEQLRQTGSFHEVWVYSDRRWNKPGETRTDSQKEKLTRTKFSSVVTDAERSRYANIWVSNFAVSDEAGQLRLSVVVHAKGQEGTLNVGVQFTCFTKVESSSDFVKSEVAKKSITIDSGGSEKVETAVSDQSPAFCRVSVTPTQPCVRDRLQYDNYAWAAKGISQNSIGVKSTKSITQLKLDKISSYSVIDLISKNSFTETPPTILLFDNVELDSSLLGQFPKVSTLAVAPPTGALPWGGRVETARVQSAPITRWIEAHPVLKYLNPALLEIRSYKPLRCPDSATSVLNTSDGSLCCIGEQQGRRYAILGFALFPFDGAATPTLSILTLNILKWLSEGSNSLNNNHIGDISELEKSSSVVRLASAYPAENLEQEEDQSLLIRDNTFLVDAPGVLQISSASKAPQILAYNYSSDLESDLISNSSVSLQNETQSRTLPLDSKVDIWRFATWLATILLLLDLLRRTLFVRGKR